LKLGDTTVRRYLRNTKGAWKSKAAQDRLRLGVEMIVEPLEMIVTTAFPGAELGIANEQIAAAEARLHLVLPEPLKDFFAVAGGSRELMDADYRILPPEKLRVDGSHLIFCEENQGLEDFGIPLAEIARPTERPNPTVDVRSKGNPKWFCEAGNLSAFLLGMTAWQVVLALPEKARCPFPEDELKKLLAFFEPIGAPQVRLGGHRFGLVDRKNSIVATYFHTTEMLYVGSPREDVLDELEQKSGLDLESL
jgi:hypothetical protein